MNHLKVTTIIPILTSITILTTWHLTASAEEGYCDYKTTSRDKVIKCAQDFEHKNFLLLSATRFKENPLFHYSSPCDDRWNALKLIIISYYPEDAPSNTLGISVSDPHGATTYAYIKEDIFESCADEINNKQDDPVALCSCLLGK